MLSEGSRSVVVVRRRRRSLAGTLSLDALSAHLARDGRRPRRRAGPVIPDFGEASDCVQENRLFCPDWVRDNWGEVLQPALLQHVKLTVIAVAVGFVIAFRAALVARRLPLASSVPFDLVSALLYTVPSLALFQLLVPITGLDA